MTQGIETIGIALSSHFDFPLNNLLNTNPAPMGIMIILKISHIMLTILISINSPASKPINNGVTNGAIKVVMEVMVMERARLAFAR